MSALMTLHAGSASDPGLQRAINEDRIWLDDARGTFLVVDGLGGHLAGETAAETAVQVISEHLASLFPGSNQVERLVSEAITAANNRIFELAQEHEQWAGMACVLTLAVVQDEQVTVGHVGDSRLYLIRHGAMQKVTSDHSPVGEWEECGVLTEEEAMRHPRRHEVFRDVGSEQRQWNDPQFVQIKRIPLPSDAALLLCTDGLTDSVTATNIRQIIREYRGDPEAVARELIAAANEAGGKDNVSVIFAPGPDFRIDQQPVPPSADRHSITRMRVTESRWRTLWHRLPWVFLGALLGIAAWSGVQEMIPQRPDAFYGGAAKPKTPVHIAVNANDARGIITALKQALPGDVIDVPPGEYLGPLVLKDQVTITGSLPHRAVVRSDPASSAGQGVVIAAHGVHDVRIENLEIASDTTHPLRVGIAISDSSVSLTNCTVSGAIESGISISGVSEATLTANVISQNPGTGLTAKDGSLVRLTSNSINDNGKVLGMLRAGLEITPTVNLQAADNRLVRNGLPDHIAQLLR